jgi:4-hydroxy-2-oxoheptanedioate aldolase
MRDAQEMNTLKQQWNSGATTLGSWLSIPSVVSAEINGRAGFDYVCVDMQHGAIDYSDVPGMIQALLLGSASPIVRVPWNEAGIIGKVLDAGAHGVIIPMVNTVAEAEAAVARCRYAPAGSRSFGPILASPRVDGAYVEWANDNIACIPMIETVQAIENLDDILAVPGIDGIYVGPADLSISLGLPPGNNDQEPRFVEALDTIVAAGKAAGVVVGIHSTGALTPRRLAAGFSMVTVVSDGIAMSVGLAAEMALARGDGAAGGADKMY